MHPTKYVLMSKDLAPHTLTIHTPCKPHIRPLPRPLTLPPIVKHRVPTLQKRRPKHIQIRIDIILHAQQTRQTQPFSLNRTLRRPFLAGQRLRKRAVHEAQVEILGVDGEGGAIAAAEVHGGDVGRVGVAGVGVHDQVVGAVGRNGDLYGAGDEGEDGGQGGDGYDDKTGAGIDAGETIDVGAGRFAIDGDAGHIYYPGGLVHNWNLGDGPSIHCGIAAAEDELAVCTGVAVEVAAEVEGEFGGRDLSVRD